MAEGVKKKIRIHVPQKVKHIHHYKKIYITNHPASAQYAPAFMTNAEGAIALPTDVELPAYAKRIPLKTVQDFSGYRETLSAGTKLLPLYHTRGYYGPNQSEWDDQDYDLVVPPKSTEALRVSATVTANRPKKRIKVVRLNQTPLQKKVKLVSNVKSKKVRGKRLLPPPVDDHPVSTLYEQFYSDLEGTGMIKKVKKPTRIEKIIDGDTEHIHTYSEEHIHKLVFDDEHKESKLTNINPMCSMSAFVHSRPSIHIKHHQPSFGSTTGYSGFVGTVGSLGTPPHLEYASYNPFESTHDHIFHDHGEIPPDMDLTKDSLSPVPKVSKPERKLKKTPRYKKPLKTTSENDFSYHESMYTPYSKSVKPFNPDYSHSVYTQSDDYRPIPALKFNHGAAKEVHSTSIKDIAVPEFQLQQTSEPFTLSSTVVHEYEPKPLTKLEQTNLQLTNFKDPFANIKNSYSRNLDPDTFASSSNIQIAEDKTPYQFNTLTSTRALALSGDKYSRTIVDKSHDSLPSSHQYENSAALEDNKNNKDIMSTDDIEIMTYPFGISSSDYNSEMAKKAFQGEQIDESDNNNQNYTASTSSQTYLSSMATTSLPKLQKQLKIKNAYSEETDYTEVRNLKKSIRKTMNPTSEVTSNRFNFSNKDKSKSKHIHAEENTSRELKYGDKIGL